MDNGKGRRVVQRQEAQITIAPARRALPAGNYHMVSGKSRRAFLEKWLHFGRTRLFPFEVARAVLAESLPLSMVT